MSGISLPVTRPIGRALIVGSPTCRKGPLGILQRLGYGCAEVDDPFAAMVELSRRPLVYRSMILCLNSLYREELPVIESVKRRFPHVEVWLTQTEGRDTALAEAMRFGAEGLLADDGLHRTALAESGGQIVVEEAVETAPEQEESGSEPLTEEALNAVLGPAGDDQEPVLSAEELRALLQEQPSPSGPD